MNKKTSNMRTNRQPLTFEDFRRREELLTTLNRAKGQAESAKVYLYDRNRDPEEIKNVTLALEHIASALEHLGFAEQHALR